VLALAGSLAVLAWLALMGIVMMRNGEPQAPAA
jgi:hypothetical protein